MASNAARTAQTAHRITMAPRHHSPSRPPACPTATSIVDGAADLLSITSLMRSCTSSGASLARNSAPSLVALEMRGTVAAARDLAQRPQWSTRDGTQRAWLVRAAAPAAAPIPMNGRKRRRVCMDSRDTTPSAGMTVPQTDERPRAFEVRSRSSSRDKIVNSARLIYSVPAVGARVAPARGSAGGGTAAGRPQSGPMGLSRSVCHSGITMPSCAQ